MSSIKFEKVSQYTHQKPRYHGHRLTNQVEQTPPFTPYYDLKYPNTVTQEEWDDDHGQL